MACRQNSSTTCYYYVTILCPMMHGYRCHRTANVKGNDYADDDTFRKRYVFLSPYLHTLRCGCRNGKSVAAKSSFTPRFHSTASRRGTETQTGQFVYSTQSSLFQQLCSFVIEYASGNSWSHRVVDRTRHIDESTVLQIASLYLVHDLLLRSYLYHGGSYSTPQNGDRQL